MTARHLPFGGPLRRLRTSTVVLTVVFAAVLAVYLLVRPVPPSVAQPTPTPTRETRPTPTPTPVTPRAPVPSPAAPRSTPPPVVTPTPTPTSVLPTPIPSATAT